MPLALGGDSPSVCILFCGDDTHSSEVVFISKRQSITVTQIDERAAADAMSRKSSRVASVGRLPEPTLLR